MSYVLNTPGPTTIYATSVGSTQGTGEWYRVPPKLKNLSVQAILATSSAGATAGTTVYIEVANSTSIPVATKARTIALTATTDLVSDGGNFQSTMDVAWAWVRAKVNSLTTSTAGSAGSPAVSVIINAGY